MFLIGKYASLQTFCMCVAGITFKIFISENTENSFFVLFQIYFLFFAFLETVPTFMEMVCI